jgi:hypothetical protein
VVFPPWLLVLVLGKDGRWEGAGGAMVMDVDRVAEAIEVYLHFYTKVPS